MKTAAAVSASPLCALSREAIEHEDRTRDEQMTSHPFFS
jgi:hypothetical protein